jgi:hypothetical protein
MQAGASTVLETDNHHSDWGRDGVSGWSDVATTNWSFRSFPPVVVDRAATCGGAMPCPSLPTNDPTALLPGRLPYSQLELTIRSSALQAI